MNFVPSRLFQNDGIDHIEKLRAYTKHLISSQDMHCLMVDGPPGWGKSFTVEQVLRRESLDYRAIGSYSTPLHFYNCLCETPNMLLVLDDCAGLFGDKAALSILKAATWQSTGSSGARVVSWGSTSSRVLEPSVVFTGKLLLLTNNVPSGAEAEALISRSIFFKINPDSLDLRDLLITVASDTEKFPDQQVAARVVEFLIDGLEDRQPARISLRTLSFGYELALANPENWESLLASTIPQTLSPRDLVKRLHGRGAAVIQQEKEFIRQTGRSRRTFYSYRSELGLADGAILSDGISGVVQ
jgi:hypothetical protein